jgi:hypothetical protein
MLQKMRDATVAVETPFGRVRKGLCMRNRKFCATSAGKRHVHEKISLNTITVQAKRYNTSPTFLIGSVLWCEG